DTKEDKEFFRGPDLGEELELLFTLKSTIKEGLHTIDIVYYGQEDSLNDADLMVSEPDGDAEIELSRESVVFGRSTKVYGWSFDADEAITVMIPGVDFEEDADCDANGAIEDLYVEVLGDNFEVPAGDYLVYVDSDDGPDAMLTVHPRFDKDDLEPEEKGAVGDEIFFDEAIYGLMPHTRYVLIFDVSGKKEIVARFTTNGLGSWGSGDDSFDVPEFKDGDYILGVAPEADTSAIVDVYNDKAKKLDPVFTVETPEELSIEGGSSVAFIPLSQVQIEWEVPGLTDKGDAVEMYVDVDDYTVYSGLAYYDDDTIMASFVMPNGDAGDVTLTVHYRDYANATNTGTITTVIERISGSGALTLEAVDVSADVAYIKDKVDTFEVSLADLDAKIVAIADGQALISTTLGVMNATLDSIKASLVEVGEDATISTILGDIKTSVEALSPKVSDIQGDVATVVTAVGTLQGTVEAVKGDVATVKTDVGTIKADVSGVSAKVDTSTTTVQGMSNILYAAVGLALVAALAAIASVVQISRKIAG
ncbi:MAG: hypothetical protein ACE5Z5_12280, partial [Candidatus Bathyarchaeia archaeon]